MYRQLPVTFYPDDPPPPGYNSPREVKISLPSGARAKGEQEKGGVGAGGGGGGTYSQGWWRKFHAGKGFTICFQKYS